MSKEPRLTHKLLITFKLSPEKPVSGDVFKVTLILKNIGDSVFSGGQLTLFSIKFQSNTISLSTNELPKIPAIEVGESKELQPYKFTAIEGGVGWIGVSLKPVDEAEMHLFQNPDYDMGSSWGNAFQVTKKEYAEIIDLLRTIVELLKKRVEKQ